jgi:hypothetical protein
MKKSLKSRTFLFVFLLFSAELFADTFGFINSVRKENAFLIFLDQSASIAKNGDFLEAGSQLLIEEGGLVIFSDYFDHRYQISSGSLVKFKSEGFELLRGSLRIKTLAPSGKVIKVETPNSIISFSDSEGVISYDQNIFQTDVVSFDGVFELRSKSNLNSSTDVSGGNSSFVRNGFQVGMASISSKTTPKELEKMASTFMEAPNKGRAVASNKEGKIIIIKAKSPKPSKSRKRGPSSKEKDSIPVPIRIMGKQEYRRPTSEPTQPYKSIKKMESLLKDLRSYEMEP